MIETSLDVMENIGQDEVGLAGNENPNDLSVNFSKRNMSDQQILDVFGDDVLSQDVGGDSLDGNGNPSGSRLKSLRKKILSEMSAIDPERALTSMQSWAKFVQLAASRKRSEPFASLEEYIPYRTIDAGEMNIHQNFLKRPRC